MSHSKTTASQMTHRYHHTRGTGRSREKSTLHAARRPLCYPAAMKFALSLCLFASTLSAQTPLQGEIRKIAADARGKVAVVCSLPGSELNCDLEAHSRPPMQSVF